MIALKQLINRQYEGKKPVEFEYRLDLGKDENSKPITTSFVFQRASVESNVWMMKTQFNRTANSDTQCYYIGFEMPRDNLPLELICATGLRYFKLQMQQEIQFRSNIDFSIGAVTEGM